MMKKLFLISLLLIGLFASAQYQPINRPLQYVNTYGYQYERFHAMYLMGLPSDTFYVPTLLQNIPFIANKAGSIYTWNISTHVWDLFSSGGSGVAVDTIYRTPGVDSIYFIKDGNTRAVKDSVGTARENINIGAFFRLLNPATQGIKGLQPGLFMKADSATANTITISGDSANAAFKAFVRDTAFISFDSLGSAGISPLTVVNNIFKSRRISISGGSIDTTAQGGILITIAASANPALSNLTSPTAINQHLLPGVTNSIDVGSTSLLYRLMYSHGYVVKNSSNGLTTISGAPSASNFTITLPAATGVAALLGLAQTWTQAQTLSALTILSGGFVSANSNANFAVPTASGLGGTTISDFLLESNPNVSYRAAFHGATAVATANSSAGAVLIAQMPLQEASNNNHDLLFTLAVKPSQIIGAGATVTNTATLEVVGPMSATVTGANWAVRIKSGNQQILNGSLFLGTAGNKINITTGSNASVGTSTLVGGTVTVSTTAVTASSKIYLTVGVAGGTQGTLSVGTVTAGTSFVINSTSGTETSQVNWWIIN